jgi:hypothetical protein
MNARHRKKLREQIYNREEIQVRYHKVYFYLKEFDKFEQFFSIPVFLYNNIIKFFKRI